MNIETLILKLIGHECVPSHKSCEECYDNGYVDGKEDQTITQELPELEFVGNIGSTDIANLFLNHYSMEYLEGKLKITPGWHKLVTFESFTKRVIEAKISSEHVPFVPYFHSCGKYAADVIGHFAHDPETTGTAIGSIHFRQPENHVVNILVGVQKGLNVPEIRFWEGMDGVWKYPTTVFKHPLDMVWMP